MSVKRLYNDRHYFPDSSGNNALSGGKLFVYLAGSTTKASTFNSSTGAVANANPLVLDSAGRLQSEVWGTTGIALKLVLTTSTDTDPPGSPIWTEDNVTVLNDASPSNITGEWVASGLTPTYISANSFSVTGDQTLILPIGRRLQIVDAGGTKYASITNSVFGAVTTVTVLVDGGGSLSNPVSSVAYGILNSANPSTPNVLTAAQLVFPATQLSSSGVNTLDDYEEGTWTPVLAFGGASVGITYSRQVGIYTKIGNFCSCTYQITLTSKGSSVGGASVTLPFATTTTINGVSNVYFTSMTTSLVSMSGNVDGGAANTVSMVGSTAAATNGGVSLNDTNFSNTTQIRQTVNYQIT